MKTLNNKGFMLAETLIVTVIVSSFILFMYTQVYNVMNNYRNQMNYETPKAIYALGTLRDYIYNDNRYKPFAEGVKNKIYQTLTASQFSNTSYATKLFQSLNVKQVIFFKNNITAVRSLNYENNFDENMKAYLKTLEQKDQEAECFLVVVLNNGEYGSLPLQNATKDSLIQIQGNAALTTTVGSKISFQSGLTATSSTGEDISALIECVGNVNLNEVGTYTTSCFIATNQYSSNIFIRQIEVQA